MKRKICRIMAFIMCIIMCLTNITPIIAENKTLDSIGSINDEDDGINIGIDKTQNTNTSYSEEIELESSQNTDVYVSQSSTFGVFIPKVIVLNGEKDENGLNIANYVVSVSNYSNIGGMETINIVPDESFEMTSFGKSSIIANVTQDKVSWKYNELYLKGNGVISTNEMSAGMWNGKFNFNISLNDSLNSSITVIAKDKNGVNLNASASEIVGDKKDILLNSLVESGFISSIDEVNTLIDVKSNKFDDFANTTFNVSSIAQQGDRVIILHFDETINEWEYVSIEIVDENGEINTNFTSFSPVAFVKVNEDGTFSQHEHNYVNNNCTICNSKEPGIYTIDDTLLKTWEQSGIDNSCSNFRNQTSSIYQNVKVVLPNTIKTIAPYSFSSSKVVDVKISNSVTKISNQAFDNCTSLKSIEIPNNVTFIGHYAFNGCTSLSNVTLPNGITTIEQSTFYGCSNLTNIEIPNTVTTIYTTAFAHCSNLSKIVIPTSVKYIGTQTFLFCKNLTTIKYMGTREEWNNVTKVSYWNQNCPTNMQIIYQN